MTHIKTASDIETANKKTYKVADEKLPPKVADQEAYQALVRIFELTRKKDELELEISTLKGKIMGVLGAGTSLVDDKGNSLVTWGTKAGKKSVDYDAIFAEANVSMGLIAKHTTYGKPTRVFEVVDEAEDIAIRKTAETAVPGTPA